MTPDRRPAEVFRLGGKRVWVAGHNGMVGRALLRRLATEGCEILVAERGAVDLRRQAETEDWMATHRPQLVIVAAAKVGGVHANSRYPGEFIYDNLAIATNIIEAARRVGVEKLLFLGSSCIYPKYAPQPIPENALLTGPLEPTNEWYAVAKIAGIKLCQAYRRQYGCDFITAQPTNLYGPFDTFDLDSSHVVPALLAKAHQAKATGARELRVWGTGSPLREFLFVDDLADGLVHLIKHYSGPTPVNIGSGEETTIAGLAELISTAVGLRGTTITYDIGKPDGTPRKLVDAGFLARLGWTARTPLREGLALTYEWYVHNVVGRHDTASPTFCS
jgi:GDP-L-fucose synthase